MKIAKLKRFGFYGALVGTTALGTLLAVRARAAGIPDAAALTYTGYLENPDGSPVTGTKGIGVFVYDAETKGTRVCGVDPADVTPVSGRFQITLPDECTDAVKANVDLWVEVQVEGSLLGRTKLGAVPYAIEAAHAVAADAATTAAKADTADAASGALHTRIAAIEDGLPGKSAFYAFTATSNNPLPSGAYNAIGFDTEKYDLGSEFAPATHAFKAATAGYYFFSCNAHLNIAAPGTSGFFQSFLFVNGVNSGEANGQGDLFAATRNVSQLLKLAKNDQVTCVAFQSTGAAQTVTGTFVGFRVSL